MNIVIRIFVVTLLMAVGASVSYAKDYRRASRGTDVYYVEAKVTDVQPVYRTVQVTTPRETCWDEPVRQTVHHPGARRTFTPTIVGGIIGGVVGNQFGSGSGQDAMTVAGALLGASIGRDAAYRRHAYTTTRYVNERRCETEEFVHEEERLEGYRVYYSYQGRNYMTQMANDPGKRIRLRVQVNPASGY